MNEILPPENDDDHRDGGHSRSGNFLTIGHLHYHANDLSELRKLAEVDPELAAKVVDQRDRENARIVSSYKLGIIASIVLLGLVLTAVTSLIIFSGIIETLIAVAAILAVAVLVRVVLTGEWSDTSWFGKLINAVLKALGGKPAD